MTSLCLSCGFEGLRTIERHSFNSIVHLKKVWFRGAVRFSITGMDVKIKREEFLDYGYQVGIFNRYRPREVAMS